MSKYEWNGSEERDWRIREIQYVLRTYNNGTRDADQTISRIADIVNGEKRKD